MSNNLFGQMFKRGYAPRLADAGLTLVAKLYDFGDEFNRDRIIEPYGPGGRFVLVRDSLTFENFCFDGDTGTMLYNGQPTRFGQIRETNPTLTGIPPSKMNMLNLGYKPMRAADIGQAPHAMFINPDVGDSASYKKWEDGTILMGFNGAYQTGKLPTDWVDDGSAMITPTVVTSSVANRPGLLWLGAARSKSTGLTRLYALADPADFGVAMAQATGITSSGTTLFETSNFIYMVALTNALNGNNKRGVGIVNIAGNTYGICFTVGVSNFTPLLMGGIFNSFIPNVHLVGALATGTNDFITVGWIDNNGKPQVYFGKSSTFAQSQLTTSNSKTGTYYGRSAAGTANYMGSSKVMHGVAFMRDKGLPQTSPQSVDFWFDNGSAAGAWLTFDIPSDSTFNAEVELVAAGLINTTNATYQRRIVAVQRTRISDGAKFIQIWTRAATGSFTALAKYIPYPPTAQSQQIAQIRGRVVNTSTMEVDLILWNGVYRFTV